MSFRPSIPLGLLTLGLACAPEGSEQERAVLDDSAAPDASGDAPDVGDDDPAPPAADAGSDVPAPPDEPDEPDEPAACGAESSVSGCVLDADGDSRCTLMHDGIERTFLLHAPPSDGAPRPLVFAFHGLRTNASMQRWMSKMNDEADARGMVVAYPEGLGADAWSQSFNAGLCCGYASENDVDDVGFALAILEVVQASLCIDERRVFATGLSNGGHMAYRLACERADVFAAIAPVAGVEALVSCTPTRPVPVLHFHGTEDAIVSYQGGIDGFTGAEDIVARWAERNDCADTPAVVDEVGDVTCVAYSGCASSSAVELCSVEGGGHTWPGGEEVAFLGATTQDMSASARMLAFFAAHPMP